MERSNEVVHVITIIDGATEDFLDIIQFPTFDLKAFHIQFDVDPTADPEMLDRYSVGPDDLPFLEKTLGRQLNFDFARYAYFIEAAQR